MTESQMLEEMRREAKARNEGLKKEAAVRLKRNVEWNKEHK